MGTALALLACDSVMQIEYLSVQYEKASRFIHYSEFVSVGPLLHERAETLETLHHVAGIADVPHVSAGGGHITVVLATNKET